jgi:hypothetical protein
MNPHLTKKYYFLGFRSFDLTEACFYKVIKSITEASDVAGTTVLYCLDHKHKMNEIYNYKRRSLTHTVHCPSFTN